MAISSGSKDGIFNEINITPLTDIFLVLLIIMMVVAPMFQSNDQDIEVPEINSGINIEHDEENVTLAVTKEGLFYINSKEIPPQKLTLELKDLVNRVKEKKIIVKADKDVKSKQIIKIIKAAQATGFEKLVVAGEPLSKKQQEKLKDDQEHQEEKKG